MDIEIKSWLYDISNAIEEITNFLAGINNLAAFQADLKTRRAIERNIEIIGEAMSRLLNKDASIQLSNARKIVDTRNRIIHGYDSVSNEIIWNIVTQYLPLLKQEVGKLIHA
jgi:uncharacterized protein with HEPN domain